MSESIQFKWAELPVSVNALYFQRGGRRILSAAGRKFKNKFVSELGGADKWELMSFKADQEAAYELHIWFYLDREHLYNLTYGKDKRVKSPFKDVDTSNMIKLVEDCISQLVGIRDRNNFSVFAHKRLAAKGNHLVAVLSPLNLEEDPYGFKTV